MRLTITSFGHKFDPPPEADLVLDARILPNPYNKNELRNLCGKDAAVVLWFGEKEACSEFIGTAYVLMNQGMNASKDKGLYRVAVGCTGGHHRSVYVAEQLGGTCTLDSNMYKHSVTVEHRDLDHPSKTRRIAQL